MPTQHLSQFSEKLDDTQRGKSWSDATQAIKQAAQQGDLPQTFSKAAELCDRAYESLPSQHQQVMQEVSPDTRGSILMLAASIQQNDNDPQQVKAIEGFVTGLTRETVSNS